MGWNPLPPKNGQKTSLLLGCAYFKENFSLFNFLVDGLLHLVEDLLGNV
jgi:hypothetical protein